MTVMLLALALLSGLEMSLFLPAIWRHRTGPAILILILMALVNGAVFMYLPLIGGLLVLSVGLYRLFNLVRIAGSRIDARRLHSMTWRTSWQLVVTQTVIIAAVALLTRTDWSGWTFWVSLAVAQVIAGVILLVSTRRQLIKTAPLALDEPYTDHELPSITVCIPARNETDTLAACLKAIIASDYPKLEIIVLDDCSQDKTSEVIKSFAHGGVRFLHGTVPADTWLAKTWAYEQLYEAANGDYLIFCGVDIRLEPGSLRAMVSTALSKHKSMLCFLPRNITPPDLRPSHSTLIQPMRYAWELALPRRRFNRPPALSSCWLIERELLRKGGSFAAVSRSIDPERSIARWAIKHDGYSFLRSNDAVPIISQKTLSDQVETAVRMRYPQLRRRPELVWLLSLFELTCLIGPLALGIGSLVTGHWLIAILSGTALVLSNYAYFRIVQLTYRRFLWRGLLALPFAALADIGIRHFSMWQYEFSEVYWKGRNICLPVMQVIPRLPKVH